MPKDLALNIKTKQKQFDNQAEYKLFLLKTLKSAYEKVKNIKEQEQLKYKTQFDKTHKEIRFGLGDLVWVYFGLPVVGKTTKLLPRFQGPYEVTAQLDSVTYRLKKDEKLIVAHVQRLIPFHEWEKVLI